MYLITPTFSTFMARARRAIQDYLMDAIEDTPSPFLPIQQPVFTELLTRTACLPHGRNPLAQEDDEGALWEYIAPLSQPLAYRLLQEASGNKVVKLPQEQQFIIFNGDGAYIWALYASDATVQYGVIRTPARRYYQTLLRGKYNTNITRIVVEALQPMYGHDTLPPPPMVEEVRDTIIP